MMMRAFVPSAATASDATATSGLGSGLSSGSQSKNIRKYLKLILGYFFCQIVVHIPNFIQIGQKNIEVKKIGYRSALVGWSG